jgi:core-2/I-Branching enzyme
MTATVCYYVQSHRGPEQVHRLIRALRAGAGPIVVRHDFTACPLDWTPVSTLPDTHLLPGRGPHRRYQFSGQLEPFLEVIDWLEREGVRYDWLVKLSGQDYPVMPVPAIEAALDAAGCDGFIRHWDVLRPNPYWSRRKAKARYWYRYRQLSDRLLPLLRALRGFTRVLPVNFYLACGAQVGIRRLRPPFRAGFRCQGGWSWFSLRRGAVRYLAEFLREHPEVLAHYRGTLAAEESLVQTVLVNSRRFDLVDDDRRYIDYSRSVDGSPRTLTSADLPLLRGGGFHFARKFDLEVDAGVLDRIDRELLAAS